MRSFLIGFAFLGVFSLSVNAENVTITDDASYNADSNAILDVKSESKGILIPRVALVGTNAPIAGTKPSGLMIYNTSTSGAYSSPGYYVWDGADWAKMAIVGKDTIKWEVSSAASVQAKSNHGYILDNTQRVDVSLPSSPKVGDRIRITSINKGGWKILQNSGQTIKLDHFQNAPSFIKKSFSYDLGGGGALA